MKQLAYIKTTTLALSLIFLAGGCSQDPDFLATSGKVETTDSKPVGEKIPWIPGEAYVKFKKKPNADGLRSLSLRSLSTDEIELKPIFDTSGPLGEAIKREGLDRWYSISFSKDSNTHEVIEELSKDSNVERVHGGLKVDQRNSVAAVPAQGVLRALTSSSQKFSFNDSYRGKFNDPMLEQQWHYSTTKLVYPYGMQGADINLFPAWDVTTGDPDVVVAVIDAGVDFNHPDLSHAKWIGKTTSGETLDGGWNFYKDNRIIEPGFHGTHVAGTIAAKNNNGIGGCGVAGGGGNGDGVKIMSLQVFSSDTDYDGTKQAKIDGFARAFTFAAEHGALIVNCSWGFSYNSSKYTPASYADTYRDYLKLIDEAVTFFNKYAGCDSNGMPKAGTMMKGGLVFFAAGNDGENDIEIIPSSLPQVISVAAYRADFNIAEYSNRGKWVDILAPGGDITHGNHLAPCFGILSTVTSTFSNVKLGDKMGSEYLYYGDPLYAYAQGTSMATPHVTGVAALVISHFGKDKSGSFTSDDLRKRILSAIKPIDPESNNEYNSNIAWRGNMGVGYLDAGLALAPKGNIKPDAPKLTLGEVRYYDAKVSWSVTEDSDDATSKKTTFVYDLYLNKGKDNVSYKSGEEYAHVYSRAKSVGDELKYEFSDLETNQDYTLVVVARDRDGNTAKPVSVSFKTKHNNPPKITNMPSGVTTILDTTPYYEFDFEVKDADKHEWEYTSSLPAQTTLERRGDKLHLHINVNGLKGKHKVEIELYDLLDDKRLGGHTSEIFEFELRSHQAPKQVSPISQVALQRGGSAATINLADVFASTTGQSLSYKATSRDESIVKASVEGQSLVLTPGSKAGYTSVSLVVSDGDKQTVVAVQVLVSEQGQSQVYALYPQPAHSYMRILVNPSVKSIEAIVTSMRGEILQQETLSIKGQTNEATIEIDRLAPGTYHLLVKAGGVTSKHTFIKN